MAKNASRSTSEKWLKYMKHNPHYYESLFVEKYTAERATAAFSKMKQAGLIAGMGAPACMKAPIGVCLCKGEGKRRFEEERRCILVK